MTTTIPGNLKLAPRARKRKDRARISQGQKTPSGKLHHSCLWQCHLALGMVPSTAHQPLPSTATSWGTGNGSYTRTLQGPRSWQTQAAVPSTLGTAWSQEWPTHKGRAMPAAHPQAGPAPEDRALAGKRHAGRIERAGKRLTDLSRLSTCREREREREERKKEKGR